MPEPPPTAAAGRSAPLPRGGVPRGAWAEALALAHLEARGARLVARNVRLAGGELDLVVLDGGVLAVVEVKGRGPRRRVTGREAVSPAKQARLRRTAVAWLVRQGHDPDRVRLRFDVVEVTRDAAGDAVTWLRDAFGGA